MMKTPENPRGTPAVSAFRLLKSMFVVLVFFSLCWVSKQMEALGSKDLLLVPLSWFPAVSTGTLHQLRILVPVGSLEVWAISGSFLELA